MQNNEFDKFDNSNPFDAFDNQSKSSAYVPMSAASSLPPTWSPTVNGKKVNAVYDPSAQAYITSDFGSTQKVVRQRDGTLALADHKNTPTPVDLVHQQYVKDMQRVKPTDDMSGLEKTLAGMGHGMVQIPRGIGQMVGAYSQEEIDRMKDQDADLMATPQGGLGSFGGQMAVGAALPVKMPFLKNPILNRATMGGLFGASQPTATGESRAANAAMGAAAGVVLPPVITATGRAIASASNRVAPQATQALSQGVSRGVNAVNNAKANAVSKYPVLGTELNPEVIVRNLRTPPPTTPPIDAPNAMPNPSNPDAIKIAQQGADDMGFKWNELNEELQRRMAANADEALRLGSDLTPQQIARKTMLEAQGFIPTRADVTGQSEDFSVQNSLMLHPEGEQLRLANVANNQNLERSILGLAPDNVQAMPTPQYGETIRKGLGAEKAVAENRTSNLYKAAAKNEGDILTNADELVNALKSPASFAVTKVDSPLRQYIKAIGKDELFFPSNPNAPSKPKELTMQELATLRQIVNSKWENIDDATQSQLNGLRGILNKMEANPNAPAPIYNKARIGRIVQGNKWEQPLLDKIFAQDKNYKGVYKLDNEDLFKATIKHTSLEEFTPLWARMNAQQRDLTRAQLAQEMRNEVFSNMQLNAGANRLEQGSPAKLIRYIDNVGYDKLKIIYGKQKADELALLQRTWKELSSSPQGTKSFGSAPEIARLHRMTLNLLGDIGGKVPLIGKYLSKGATGATKAAEANAEAANRALNTNRAIDPSFDARTREINALRDLSIQRAKDIKAKKNARMVSPANAGVSALREYMKNQDEQGGQ